MPNDSEQRIYETANAEEKVRQRVVQLNDNILESYGALSEMMPILIASRKRHPRLENRFKTDVILFFQMLRPKMLDKNSPISEEKRAYYREVVSIGDFLKRNLSKVSIQDFEDLWDILCEFTEDYKLTSTSAWTGYTMQGDMKYDIYKQRAETPPMVRKNER